MANHQPRIPHHILSGGESIERPPTARYLDFLGFVGLGLGGCIAVPGFAIGLIPQMISGFELGVGLLAVIGFLLTSSAFLADRGFPIVFDFHEEVFDPRSKNKVNGGHSSIAIPHHIQCGGESIETPPIARYLGLFGFVGGAGGGRGESGVTSQLTTTPLYVKLELDFLEVIGFSPLHL